MSELLVLVDLLTDHSAGAVLLLVIIFGPIFVIAAIGRGAIRDLRHHVEVCDERVKKQHDKREQMFREITSIRSDVREAMDGLRDGLHAVDKKQEGLAAVLDVFLKKNGKG